MKHYSAEFLRCYFREVGVHTPLPPGIVSSAERMDTEAETPAAAPVMKQAAAPASVAAAPATEKVTPPVSRPPTPVVPVEASSLDALRAQVAACQRCALAKGRKHTVFGTGDPKARLVIIGEAPGAEEDRQGEPFVGPAGQLLNRMLAAIGLQRSDVYIMNTIKCRPPWNRDPGEEEMRACRPWLDAQLRLLQAQHLCLLGRVAAHQLLRSDAPLGVLRQKLHTYQGIPVTVTYHPAYLLRSSPRKQQAWEDLQRMAEALSF